MTTRLGQPPASSARPTAQRSLSTSHVLPRPSPHRSLSQQHTSSSPTRRGNEAFVDLTLDGPEGVPGRTIPRSRLNLEIGKETRSDEMLDSPKAVSEATPTRKPSAPPRGRPQLHFDVPSVSNLSSRAALEASQNEGAINPMPLPVRPGQHGPPNIEKKWSAPTTSAKKDARPKPYHLEVPAAAPRYPPNGHVDFYPWTGNHPEDQFSENVIRHGYFDRAQMTQNETGTARASIFPALKHKSGLQTLSSLFTTVLAQRRAHGQITASSTFKPPPRVTVTDTKREMWLKDLANPTISLRRLSRSIPHGIRGKVLLDQSLSKNIPIERAVWLAKCVGANELRSFRRKGASGTFNMGGEAKWIRDFTVCVEQFVESIVGQCGDKDFKTRISYAVRLAAHFHAEYLLDREHYMDWLVSSLENSNQAKLPMWLLVTQIYWRDLLQYRKYGRRLSTALLIHLSETLAHPDLDLLAPLSERLSFLLKGIMRSSPDSFVSPKVWVKHREIVRSSLEADDHHMLPILAEIDRRNSRLSDSSTEEKLSSRRQLIKHLDTTLSQPITNELPQQCWELDENKNMLIQTVLEWSTSLHRPGVAKIFVAARIFRHWSRHGGDITLAVLNFLDSGHCEIGRNKPQLYHLISELARSKHFSTSRYLQWLIARGGLYEAAEVANNGPCATRLLAELPTHNISDNICELRETLLGRAGFVVDDEDDLIKDCMATMISTLPGMHGNEDRELKSGITGSVDSLPGLVRNCSRTTLSEIGLWLRQKVRKQVQKPTRPPLDDWDDSPLRGETSSITPSEFSTVRTYLEMIDDFSMLADILKIVTSSTNSDVLASCADTLNLHLEIFAAIGALRNLFDLLMLRLRTLTEEIDSIPRGLLVSMSDLASRLPDQKMVAMQLAQELARSDRKTAADACSPVSDHMALMQSAEADFTDEIEKVLASGNSMDQATLERLFQRIILRLEESWDKSSEQQRSCGLLLTRLRTFDSPQFDVLMSQWVTHFLQLGNRPSMMLVLGPLISFGCLTLPDVVRNLDQMGDGTTNSPATSRAFQEALVLLLYPTALPEAITVEESYRLRIKQVLVQKGQHLDTMAIIRRSLDRPHLSTEDTGAQHDANQLLESERLGELLQLFVLLDANLVTQTLVAPLLKSSNSSSASKIISIIDKLLLGNELETPITADTILNLADDLTLPFCQVKLATMFNSEDSPMSGTNDGSSERLEAFDKAIESAIASGKTTWASIIPLLDISTARYLRQRAETQFLALFPSPRKSTSDAALNNQTRAAQADNLLHVIEATSNSISTCQTGSSGNASIAVETVQTLNGLWQILSLSPKQDIKDSVTTDWLPLLLSFVTLQTSVFEATKAGNESRAKAILALAASVLQLQALDTNSEEMLGLIEQTYDLALFLVDSLPEDTRLQCVRILRDTQSSSKIRYLFSYAANPEGWLVLSQKDRGQAATQNVTAGATASPEIRPVEILNKETLSAFPLRRWEMLGEPTPNVGENDTSLSLTLFGARRG